MIGAGELNVRWLGRVGYEEAYALQKSLYAGLQNGEPQNYLLLLEHPPVYTFGVRGDRSHLLSEPAELAEAMGVPEVGEFWVDRGGDITFHGPGQLVGYPILNLRSNKSGNRSGNKSGLVDTVGYVRELEDLLIEVVGELGIAGACRQKRFPGVWIDSPENSGKKKLASIGVKLSRGRTMHGFGLNVSTNLDWFQHIVPCGIPDIEMTSIRQEGINISVEETAELVAEVALKYWGKQTTNETPIKISPLKINERKPSWLRAPVRYSENHSRLKKTLKNLPTVCESAGCPNLFECWGEGTATFMINGDRCTRNCGFCLVDTRKPFELDASEPERLAEAVKSMGLKYVVITAVARDDLPDGGASGFVQSIRAVRAISPEVGAISPEIKVELLIPDFKGRQDLLDLVFAEAPEVLNHNLETVLRLQKQVRPQAGYARSLSVLARAKAAGLTTKSSLMVGLGETMEEMKSALLDLAQVGTDIVTIGQYLRPTAKHLPVARWWTPEEFAELAKMKDELDGIQEISHIEAGPLVRSSYKAGNIMSRVSQLELV